MPTAGHFCVSEKVISRHIVPGGAKLQADAGELQADVNDKSFGERCLSDPP